MALLTGFIACLSNELVAGCAPAQARNADGASSARRRNPRGYGRYAASVAERPPDGRAGRAFGSDRPRSGGSHDRDSDRGVVFDHGGQERNWRRLLVKNAAEISLGGVGAQLALFPFARGLG